MVRKIGFWPRTTVSLVKPLLVRRHQARLARHGAGARRTGGVILAANHMSEFDPFVIAHFVYDSGRWPQYLAKSSLFKIPVLGPIVKAVRQIPVERGTVDASKALDAAITAVKRGEGVIIYPEGTTPKSGDLWPQRGKTGIARLFLATGAPVIPIASWGAQQIFDPRTRKLRLRPRTPVTVVAGEEIDLSKWRGRRADGGEPVRDHRRDHVGAAGDGRRDPGRDAAAGAEFGRPADVPIRPHGIERRGRHGDR